MKSQKFLLIHLLLVLLALACGQTEPSPPPAAPTSSEQLQQAPTGELEAVTVDHVIDGDTIELADGRRIRYLGINTPEREQPFYTEARQLNQQLLDNSSTIELEFDEERTDQYGRTLAYVWADGRLVNQELVQQGVANVFIIRPNELHAEGLRAAEAEAQAAQRGIWQTAAVSLQIVHVEADAPGRDNENPNGEWIEIINSGNQPLNMQGFTLKDAANNFYNFDEFIVPPGVTFRLHSGQGNNTDTLLYWGLFDQSVWNNDGDTAFLRDTEGVLVDSFSY